jgi:hypothetical protein
MNGGALAGHADRPVRVGTWHGRQAVIKDYRCGGAHAAASSMTALWHSPFGRTRRPPGLPEPIALEGLSLVMEQIDGPAAGSRGELGATAQVTEAAAVLLADLHGSRAEVARKRSGSGIVRSLERKLRQLEAPRVQLRFAKALAALDEHALDGELVVGHGDFSPRNMLLSGDGPRLIDFDRCQMAPRERDVSYWRGGSRTGPSAIGWPRRTRVQPAGRTPRKRAERHIGPPRSCGSRTAGARCVRGRTSPRSSRARR